MTRPLRRAAVRAAAVLLPAAVLAVTAPPAAGALPSDVPAAVAGATVTVDRVDGLPVDQPTQLQVDGAGFQVVRGGFGGVYVLFGWVDDPAGSTWRPSAGGVTGVNLRYAVDEAAKDNAGHQVFVAFPGSDTVVEANGGTLGDDGSFHAVLTVPGARFTATGPQGGTTEVDCTQVTCGVLTFGAHGLENANNETFTPVTFGEAEPTTAATPEPAAEPTPAVATATAEATSSPAAAEEADDAGTPLVPVVLGVVAVAALVVGGLWWRRRSAADPA